MHGNRRFEVVGVGGEGSGLIREREKCSRSRKGKRRGAVRGIGGLGVGGRGRSVPKFIDPVFAKTSPKCAFSMTENERVGLVFVKTGSINSGTGGEGIGRKSERMGVGSIRIRLS